VGAALSPIVEYDEPGRRAGEALLDGSRPREKWARSVFKQLALEEKVRIAASHELILAIDGRANWIPAARDGLDALYFGRQEIADCASDNVKACPSVAALEKPNGDADPYQ
jgi:hypothetical protein